MSKRLLCAVGVLALSNLCGLVRAGAYSSLVVFGDSLSDDGNLYVESGGVFPSFNPGVNPLLVYTAGRLTDGPDTHPATSLSGVWVEQLATKLGVASPTPSLAGGTNYAFGGATSGTGNTALNGGLLQAQNVGDQVGLYLSTKPIDPNALYIVSAGANDITIAADAGMTTSQVITAGTTAEFNTKSEVSALLQAGAKHVLWVSVVPLEKTPNYALSPENGAVQQASAAFHTSWLADLAALQLLSPGAVTGLDDYALLGNVVANPGAFGLSNVTNSALVDAQANPGLNPDTYLFWDGEHPTTKGHQLLANAANAAGAGADFGVVDGGRAGGFGAAGSAKTQAGVRGCRCVREEGWREVGEARAIMTDCRRAR